MSRRDYSVSERFEERDTDIYRRPHRERREREYDDLEVDITRSRHPESRRAETVVKERDTVVEERRAPRRLDFLDEDYGKSAHAGQLVVREDRREEDVYSRRPSRRRDAEEEKITIRERSRGPPYPRSQQSELDVREDEEIIYRDRARSRPPPREERTEEKIDISIRRDDSRPPPPRERDVEEIRFRRGGGGPARSVVDREEIDIRERRSPAPPPRREVEKEEIDVDIRERRRGREEFKEDIVIREERSVPPPRHRSMSRGALVAKKEEEWIVRRPRTPPPRDFEKEEIIIRREKQRSPSPEPVREPTPEPPPPPPLDPIYRPPIIQEYITHHRTIDHGVERARSPTPPPPPSPPSPPREENLEIEIRRTGTRNGKPFDEDIIFERDVTDRKDREVVRDVSRRRDVSISARRRSPSAESRHFEEDISTEADYYNRKVTSRGYPGEAWNGATKDWGLVDVPPGTERVRMDGVGGGRQEVTWQRYNGERRGKFYTGDRVYEEEFGETARSPAPLPRAPSAPPTPRGGREVKEEIKITETRTTGDRPRQRDKMWTEVSKDLVIKEAVEECGYEYDETDEHFYVMEYLRYEDVVRLVEVTEDIRRQRRERIRELQWQREEAERASKIPPPPRSRYDERIYEREYIYDRDGRRWRRS